MKKKPENPRSFKGDKQGNINTSRRANKAKEDFFTTLYESQNPTLHQMPLSARPDTKNITDDQNNPTHSTQNVADPNFNTQISKVKKPKEKSNKPPITSFKVNARGFTAIKKDSSANRRSRTIQSPKQLPSDSIAPNSPTIKRTRPRTPTSSLVSTDLTNKSPKLFIPHFSSLKQSANSSHHQQRCSLSARPLPPKQTLTDLITPSVSDTLSTVSNDKLSLFDDPNFDDPDFINQMKARIKEGSVTGSSLYFTSEGELEWMPCTVLCFLPPNNFKIKFNLTGKIKVVPRISLRFDDEDFERFQKRREKAQLTRSEIDSSIKEEAYLLSKAEQINDPIEPELIRKILERLTEKEKNNGLVTQMLTEIQQQYNYAFAMINYINLWETSEESKLNFTKKGLRPIKFASSQINVLDIRPLKAPPIVIPNHKHLLEIVGMLNDVENDPFYSYVSKSLTSLNEFFEEFRFHFDTASANGRSIILNQLLEISSRMLKKMTNKEKQKSILFMVNIRYRHSLSSLTINSIDHLVNPGIVFNITSEEDPEKVDQPLDELIKKGSEFITDIYNTFIKEPPLEVDPFVLTNNGLKLNDPILDKRYNEAKIQWKNIINKNFNDYHNAIDEINKMTEGIPRDLHKKLKEILPDDYSSVLNNKENPSIDIKSINFDLIRKEIQFADKGMKEFELKFASKFIQSTLFKFDITKFYINIETMHKNFKESVFTYLTSHSKYQLNRISEMITSLDHKCRKPADNIEQWYEKSTLLLQVTSNIKSLSTQIDQVFNLLTFMSDFYYEPNEYGFIKLYEVKYQMFKVIKSLEKYKEQDINEKSSFTEEHKKRKLELQNELENFKLEVEDFNNQDPTKNVAVVNNNLINKKNDFEELKKKIELYQSRDKSIGIEITQYPIVKDIENDLNLFMPIWNIALSLGTEVPRWLSTQFRELDVNLISNTLIDWEKALKNRIEQLGSEHKMVPMLNILINDISNLIPHIQIVRAFCNPNLRSRHWNQISSLFGQEINPNESITWNWMLESGIEDYIIGINAISRSADLEYRVEKTLRIIIDDLRSLKLKVNEVDGVVCLEDPTYAVEMLSDHQRKIQEVMIPPYINPFISKIKDYEVLSTNIQKILKSTLDAQQRIDELKPAMDSKDLRVQHEDVCIQFDEQVAKFNDFTGNFQLSLSFHQIVSNQKYVDLTKDLFNEFENLKNDLSTILNEKRSQFPRFYLLSDSQLVQILSNCQNPSKSNELFNIMYPAISHALFNEDETECIGFVSIYNETIMLSNKVKVVPEKVEKWYKEFDEEIKESMRESTKVLLSKRSSSSHKLVFQYPIQIIQVSNNILFTSNVINGFEACTSTFASNRSSSLREQFDKILKNLNENFELLTKDYVKDPKIQYSALILGFINNRNTLQELIDNKVESQENPIWFSAIKYLSVTHPEFDVIVKIGPSSYHYGFEFGLSRYPFPQTKLNQVINSSLMLSMTSKIPAVLCTRIGISAIESLINFTTLIGRMPIIFSCNNYLNFDQIKKTLDVAEKVNSFIIFKDLDHLNQDAFNDLSIEVLKRKESISNSMRIFATYSVVSDCPEKLKLAYRPILLNDYDAREQFKILLSSYISNEMEYIEQLSMKLGNFVHNIAPAFFSKFNFIHPVKIIRTSIINTFNRIFENKNFNDLNEINNELHDTILNEFKKWHGNYDEFNQLQIVIDSIFNIKSNGSINKNNKTEEKVSQFEQFIQNHFAVILLGKPLSGKSMILNKTLEPMNLRVEYINQHCFDPFDLYGTNNSGLISTLIPQTDIFVFDGILKNNELETILAGLEVPHYFSFGDNTRYLMSNKNKFIFETDDISNASPALIGNCPVFFIGENFLSFNDHLKFFLERKIQNESRLIDTFSQNIVGSRISCTELCNAISEFSNFFIPKMEVEQSAPFTKDHCISNYFKYLQCSILNYYVTGNLKANLKNTAENLIEDIPDLCLFSVFWAFAAAYNDNMLKSFGERLQSLFYEKYQKKVDNIIDSYFDHDQRRWTKWTDSFAKLNPLSTDNINDIYKTMTDASPRYLLTPLPLLIPALYMTNILISEGNNVLICGSRNSSMNNLILSTPDLAENFSPFSFSFPPDGTHKIVRQMILSILPDSNAIHGFNVRKPLLSLYDFNLDYSASELIRFIIEHGYMYNDVSYVKNTIDGIRFIVSCRETDDFNQRFSHHMFVIRIPKSSDTVLTNTLSNAMSILWDFQDKNNVIASSLLKLLRESQNVFHFNIEHILTLLQRVATVKMNTNISFPVEAIAYESVSVFYNAFHSEDILRSIQNLVSTISQTYSSKQIDVNEIAGKYLLSNIHSNGFRPISSFNDLDEQNSIQSDMPKNNLKFISCDDSFINLNISAEMKEKLPNRLKQFDVLSISRALSTPRTHLTINSTSLFETYTKFVTYACEIIKADFHIKRLNEPLMKCFHDQFISGGIKKKNHVLFVSDPTLNQEEKLLLKQLVNSSDVFGVFDRGEKLQIMTDILSSGQNPFDDDTCESMDGYNVLLNDFLTDCQNYFHLCIITNDKEILQHSLIYKPYYGIEHALNHLIESIHIEGISIQEKLPSLNDIPQFKIFPYLLEYSNMKYFIKALKIRIEKQREILNSKKENVDQIANAGEELQLYLNNSLKEMESLNQLMTSLSEEIEISSKQTEETSLKAQSDAEKFEKQTKELNDQEVAAEKLRKESQKQLAATKAILESASKELKALSSRDIAIIKTMNHPPHGVVLVVSAMCLVLDQPIDKSNDDEVVWNSAKKVLNDTSFLNKLITKALDSLTPAVLDQLNVIISDPNFDPKVIQRASSAAKSICIFIRSVVPYYKALEVYKIRANEVEESQNHLLELRKQYETAMNALASSKKGVLDMQAKQAELQERKKQIENQLFEQSQKIDSYQKVDELMKPFFTQNRMEQKALEKSLSEVENHCFLQQIVVDLLGPFNNDERNQIAKVLTPKQGRYTYLPSEDNELVETWESLHYPISLFTKENTLMMSPTSEIRWIAAIGIRYVPDSFIKLILGKNIICSISVFSPNFEESFIFSIKRNQGLIIYDYDFNNPHPLIMRAFNAQSEKAPLSYLSETIYIPENFVVYFNVDQFVPKDYVNPLPPARFVNLSIGADVTTEMIALKLFNLTSLRQTHEAKQIEHEIASINEQLENLDLNLKSLLVESSTLIFVDKNMQWKFTNLARKRTELVKRAKQLKQQHLWLFDDYPTLTLLAKNLNEFFNPFNKQVSLLWSIFEAEFENVKRYSTDSLCHIAQTQIIGVFCAQLPLVERIKTCANAFGLKLDGSNSYVTLKSNKLDDSRSMRPSYSDDRLYMTSVGESQNDVEEEEQIESDERPTGILVSRSNEEISNNFDIHDSSEGFDRLIVKLNEVTEGQIMELQHVPNILKRTHPLRPVLIHTNNASYQMLAFLYIFKCELVQVDEIVTTPNFIQNAAQKGTVIVTICCNKKTLCSLLSAVSMVTASGFLSPSFRLVCFVTDMNFNAMVQTSSLFVSKCDIISLDPPMSVRSAFSSTMKSLTCEGLFTKNVSNGKAKSDSKQATVSFSKFDPFSVKLAFFDAAAVATHHLARMTKLPSFFTFREALQCASEANNANIFDIGEYIINYIYAADNELSSFTDTLDKIWKKLNPQAVNGQMSPTSPSKRSYIDTAYPVPTSLHEANIKKSFEAMPIIDEPLIFGFEKYAFDFFKEHFFDGVPKQQVKTISKPNIIAESIENLDLLLSTNVNSKALKNTIQKLHVGNVGVDTSRNSSMSSLISVANSLNSASCDFLTFEIKLDMIVENKTNPNSVKRRVQLIKAPKFIDISLIYLPRLMLDSIISQDFVELRRFNRIISVRDLKDTSKYSKSQPVHNRLFFSELFCRGAQFEPQGGTFKQFDGFVKLPPLEFFVADRSDELFPVKMIHNGKYIFDIFVRKEFEDMDMCIFSYSKND